MEITVRYRYAASISLIDTFIDTFIAICRVQCVENVESEALEAVARCSVIGKVFKLPLKLSSEGDRLTESGMSFQILGTQ